MNHEHPDRYVVTGKSFTAVAVNTASRAGEWIKSRLGHTLDIRQKTTSHDLVTEVDKGAETLICNLIHTYFPTHAFLGEEGAEPGALGAQRAIEKIKNEPYVWIVDPIDGTTNFIHGFPFFSISIALAYHGEIIVGVVYDPVHDELFVAEKGKGAYLRGKRIHVSSEAKLADSLIGTGFPADRDQMLPLLLSQISTVAPKVRNLRANGSAALHLAYVASGRLSGFWEPNLNAWDVAAGMLLVQEAGGRVTGMKGEPYHLHTRDIVATNHHIHDEMIRLLN